MFSAGVVFNVFLSLCVKQQQCNAQNKYSLSLTLNHLILVNFGISNMVVSNRTIGCTGLLYYIMVSNLRLNLNINDINKVTYLCWNIKSPIVACCISLHEEMYNHSLCEVS